MSKTTPRNAPAKQADKMASTELPADVHAKISAVANANERSFAAQLRMIAKEWAEKQTALVEA